MKLYSIPILLLLITLNSVAQPNIYEWRGNNRNGIYNETNLLDKWPENGPEEIWAVDGLGNGYGSPIIADNKIYISGEVDETAYLYCLNLQGNILWKAPYGNEWVKSYPGSRSAPTIVDDLIYIGSGLGNLYCLKKKNGQVVWSKNFNDDFQGQPTLHGFTDAAVVNGDKVFWVPGGKEFNVVALNRFTGELIWKNKGMGERSAYTQSKLIQLPNRNLFVTFSAYNLMGFDAGSGELLWVHVQDNTPLENRKPGYGDTHCNTPLYENGYLYYCAGDGNCGVKLALTEDGSKITQVWRNNNFDGYMGGIIKIGNTIYGTGTAKKVLHSVNAESGEIIQSLNIGSGAVIAANKMLYYYNQRGELFLVSQDNGKMEVISTFRISKGTKEHFSHPVINNGILYQRHGDVLMAFDIKTM